MPENPPLVAAGPREPTKQQRPIPKAVREAVRLMVYGAIDDPDCRPLGFIEAASEVGLKPDQMRRWLDRSVVRALLLRERRIFRTAINSGNEGALLRIRDTAKNAMAQIGAIRTLEELGEEDAARHGRTGQRETPGVTIRIVNVSAPPAPAATGAIDITPSSVPALDEPSAYPDPRLRRP
jgi:hypothetical protein